MSATQIERLRGRSSGFGSWWAEWRRRQVLTPKRRLRVYDQLYRYTKRGMGLRDAVEEMLATYEEIGDPREELFRRWRDGLAEGVEFSTLAAPYVPLSEALMLAAGDQISRLDTGIAKARYMCEASTTMSRTIKTAMTYPVLLLIGAMLVVRFVSVEIMPELERMWPLERWPTVSWALHYFATTMREYGLLTVGTLLAVATAVTLSLPRWHRTGAGVRRWADHTIPPYTLYREFVSASMLVAVSGLVQAGRSFEEGLQTLRQTATPWLTAHLDKMLRGLKGKGMHPSQALKTGILHRDTEQDIRVYERAGSFPEAIELVGKDIVTDATERLSAASKVVSFAVLVLVAGLLLWTVASFMLVIMEVQANDGIVPR